MQLRAFVRMGALFFRACCKLGKGTKKGPFHAERELRTAEPNMARKRAEEGEGGGLVGANYKRLCTST